MMSDGMRNDEKIKMETRTEEEKGGVNDEEKIKEMKSGSRKLGLKKKISEIKLQRVFTFMSKLMTMVRAKWSLL